MQVDRESKESKGKAGALSYKQKLTGMQTGSKQKESQWLKLQQGVNAEEQFPQEDHWGANCRTNTPERQDVWFQHTDTFLANSRSKLKTSRIITIKKVLQTEYIQVDFMHFTAMQLFLLGASFNSTKWRCLTSAHEPEERFCSCFHSAFDSPPLTVQYICMFD